MNLRTPNLIQGSFFDPIIDATCYEQGEQAEAPFAKIRGAKILATASPEQNRDEHWDVYDSDFGRVDVKSPKRFKRNGELNFTAWWELKTVNRPPTNAPAPGWGIGNGIRRYVAVSLVEGFYLLSPEEVHSDLVLMHKRAPLPRGKGEFLLYSRPGRGDLLTILSHDYVRKNARYYVAAPFGSLSRGGLN